MSSKILPYRRGMSSPHTILIVDSSSEQMFRLLHKVTDAGWSVLLADSAAACLTLAAQYKPTALLLDENLKDLFALLCGSVGEVDLRQRQLGQRRIFVVALLSHFEEELLGLGQFPM